VPSLRSVRPVSGALAAVLLALAVLTGSVFALVDFGVATSQTELDSTVSAGRSDDAALDTTGGVHVVVLGDTAHDRDLERAVVESLRENHVDADAAALRATYDRPVLVVAPTEWTLGWTPLSGDATASWRFLYVQSGDLTQFGESTPGTGDFTTDRLVDRLTGGDGIRSVALDDRTTLVASGEFGLVDATNGLLSLPYYDRHVVGAAADGTVEALLAV
jgi:hypothetical protein